MSRLIKPLLAVILIAYIVVHLIALSLRRKSDLGRIGRGVVAVASPLQTQLDAAGDAIGNLWSHYLFLAGTAKVNDALTSERDRLRSEIVRLREVALENGRLREILAMKENLKLELRAVRRIASGASPYEKTIRVNRGSEGGIAPGMAVVHPKGVVGQVLQTFGGTSDVLLLADPASAIDVVCQRSRARGVLLGQNVDTLRFEYLPKGEDIRVGDEVVTTGLDGVYPAGLPVGVVKEVAAKPRGLFLAASVRPHVNFGRLEELAIIVKGKP